MSIVLLDLNASYVENTSVHRLPHTYNIDAEHYRTWLTTLLRPHYVILITVRPARYRECTLRRISSLEAWQPQEAYFNTTPLAAPEAKLAMLRDFVFPHHGEPHQTDFIAIESNIRTRAMYAKQGIAACPQSAIFKTPLLLMQARHSKQFKF